jgi:heptosyltransferase-2
MKLVLFLPNWVGDAVMATPALAALRAQFPTATIFGVMRPVIAETLAGTGFIDEPVLFHPRGSDQTMSAAAVRRRLRGEHCELAVLFTNSLRTAWLAWRSGIRERVGFARDLRGWLLTRRLKPHSKRVPNPVLDEYNRLAMACGCPTPGSRLQLAVGPEAASLWESLRPRNATTGEPQPYLCINSGGAFGPAKNWPIASFGALARRLADSRGMPVVVNCGPAEREDARAIAAAADHPLVTSLADAPLSIGLTKAVVASASAMVTTDSGPRHFAAAFNVPVVTLFGPTHIAWSETRFPLATHLQQPVDCGPCQQRVCPLKHHRCMNELTVDRVLAAVLATCDHTAARAAA